MGYTDLLIRRFGHWLGVGRGRPPRCRARATTDWRSRPRPQRPRRRWNLPLVGSVRSWGFVMQVRDASLRPKSLEDHLVGIARGLAPVIHAAHGPGEQREAEDAACD